MAKTTTKKYTAIELLGILALLVGVSLFIGEVPKDGLVTLKGGIITCAAGFILYLWGRIGVARSYA